MKKIFVFIVFVITGCTTLKDLQPPSSNKYFVLEENLILREERGMLNTVWVLGLKADTYTLIGEDSSGYYYMGEKNDSVVLTQDRDEVYKLKGIIPPNYNMGGKGGLWIPKDHINKKPELFYINQGLDTSHPNARGITMGIISESLKGSLTLFEFNVEPEKLAQSVIIQEK